MNNLTKRIVMILTILAMLWIQPFQSQAASAEAILPQMNLLSSEWITSGAKLEKWNWKTADGIAKVNVVEVDLKNPYITVDSMGGKEGMMGNRQTMTQMSKERGAVAAINGDFFTVTAEGAPFGTHIQSGKMVTSPGYISPKNTFALNKNQIPFIGRLDFDALVTAANGATFQLFGVNKTQYQAGFRFTGNSHHNRLHMYTDQWNMKNWVGDSLNLPYTVVLVQNGVVTQILENKAVAIIPKDAYLLLGHGEAENYLKQNVSIGDFLKVDLAFNPAEELQMAIDGSSLLVKDGLKMNHTTPGRNARSAVGYSQDNRYMYMVTVERSKESIGMTFAELSDFLAQRGVWQAVNLDGGGSTTLVSRKLGEFNATTAMLPSQDTERLVPNGLGIFSTAPKGSLLGWNIEVPRRVMFNETAAISLKAYDEYYNPITPNEVPVEWKIPASILFNQDRTFIVSEPGTYEFASTLKGKTEKYTVRPYEKQEIAQIKFNTDQIRLHEGASIQTKVDIHFTDGAKRSAPATSLSWQLIGAKGSVQANGTVKAEKSSVGMLVASYQGFSTAVPVIIGASEFHTIDTFDQAGRFRTSGLTLSEKSTFTVKEDNGRKVGNFSYDFGPSTELRIAYLNYGTQGMSLAGEPAALSLEVKGDNSKHWLRAEIRDAKGAIHRIDLAKEVNWNGWKTVTIKLPQMTYPASLNSIYVVHLDNATDATANKGELSFANLQAQNWMQLGKPSRPSLVFTLDKKEVLVNQQKTTLDQAPIVVDGRTLLPVRHVTELIGGQIDWLPDQRKVQVRNNYNIYDFWLDDSFMSENGVRKDLDVKPLLSNGRTMLPLRAITDAYGLYIEYDKATRMIKIY
jgi:hypothetical protein